MTLRGVREWWAGVKDRRWEYAWYRLPRWITLPDLPYAAEWDEWDKIYATAKDRYPVRYFFRETLDTFLVRTWNRFIHEPWYRLKCRVWHRYNSVTSKYLPSTYHDPDRLLFYIAFQVFEDFIEKEEPWEVSATEDRIREAYREAYSDEAQIEERVSRARKIRELYEWWKKRARQDEDMTLAEEDASYEKDTEMLVEMVKMRESYWT